MSLTLEGDSAGGLKQRCHSRLTNAKADEVDSRFGESALAAEAGPDRGGAQLPAQQVVLLPWLFVFSF